MNVELQKSNILMVGPTGSGKNKVLGKGLFKQFPHILLRGIGNIRAESDGFLVNAGADDLIQSVKGTAAALTG